MWCLSTKQDPLGQSLGFVPPPWFSPRGGPSLSGSAWRHPWLQLRSWKLASGGCICQSNHLFFPGLVLTSFLYTRISVLHFLNSLEDFNRVMTSISKWINQDQRRTQWKPTRPLLDPFSTPNVPRETMLIKNKHLEGTGGMKNTK